MVSDRLNALIRDKGQRWYLARDDGYWADLVLSEFAFLEERMGRVDAISFHQKGDYIRYVGPWGEVLLEFAPENYPGSEWSFSRAELRGTSAFVGPLEQLVRERTMGTPPPPSIPLDRASIASTMRLWADVLRGATDLF